MCAKGASRTQSTTLWSRSTDLYEWRAVTMTTLMSCNILTAESYVIVEHESGDVKCLKVVLKCRIYVIIYRRNVQMSERAF